MILLYTKKIADGNFFMSSYLTKDFKQMSLDPQAIHMFQNTAIYFEDYPKRFKIHHINFKMRSNIFLDIDKYFFKNDKNGKEVYIYVVNLPGIEDKITFFSLNENKPIMNLKSAGIINSQIAAVNKIVQILNKELHDCEVVLKGFRKWL